MAVVGLLPLLDQMELLKAEEDNVFCFSGTVSMQLGLFNAESDSLYLMWPLVISLI